MFACMTVNECNSLQVSSSDVQPAAKQSGAETAENGSEGGGQVEKEESVDAGAKFD